MPTKAIRSPQHFVVTMGNSTSGDSDESNDDIRENPAKEKDDDSIVVHFALSNLAEDIRWVRVDSFRPKMIGLLIDDRGMLVEPSGYPDSWCNILVQGLCSRSKQMESLECMILLLVALTPRDNFMYLGLTNSELEGFCDSYNQYHESLWDSVLSSLPDVCVESLLNSCLGNDRQLTEISLAALSLLFFHPSTRSAVHAVPVIMDILRDERYPYFALQCLKSLCHENVSDQVWPELIARTLRILADPTIARGEFVAILQLYASCAIRSIAFVNALCKFSIDDQGSFEFCSSAKGTPAIVFLSFIIGTTGSKLDCLMPGYLQFGHLIAHSAPALGPTLYCRLTSEDSVQKLLVNRIEMFDHLIRVIIKSNSNEYPSMCLAYAALHLNSNWEDSDILSLPNLADLLYGIYYPNLSSCFGFVNEIAGLRVPRLNRIWQEDISSIVKSNSGVPHGLALLQLIRFQFEKVIIRILQKRVALVYKRDHFSDILLELLLREILSTFSAEILRIRFSIISEIAFSNFECALYLVSANMLSLFENLMFVCLESSTQWIKVQDGPDREKNLLFTYGLESNQNVFFGLDPPLASQEITLTTIPDEEYALLVKIVGYFDPGIALSMTLYCLSSFLKHSALHRHCHPHLKLVLWKLHLVSVEATATPGLVRLLQLNTSLSLGPLLPTRQRRMLHQDFVLMPHINRLLEDVAYLLDLDSARLLGTLVSTSSVDKVCLMSLASHTSGKCLQIIKMLCLSKQMKLLLVSLTGMIAGICSKLADDTDEASLALILEILNLLVANPHGMVLWLKFEHRRLIVDSSGTNLPVGSTTTGSTVNNFACITRKLHAETKNLLSHRPVHRGAYFQNEDCVFVADITLGIEWTISAWVTFDWIANRENQDVFVLVQGSHGDFPVALFRRTNPKESDIYELGCYHASTKTWYTSGIRVNHLQLGWHHIAVVGNEGYTAFHLDGGSQTTVIPFVCTGSVYTIGNSNNGAHPWGQVADMRVYPIAMPRRPDQWDLFFDSRCGWGAESFPDVSAFPLAKYTADDYESTMESLSQLPWYVRPPGFIRYSIGSHNRGFVIRMLFQLINKTELSDEIKYIAIRIMGDLMLEPGMRDMFIALGLLDRCFELFKNMKNKMSVGTDPVYSVLMRLISYLS